MTTTIRKGFTFTHRSFIDPDWTGPVSQGPKALMVVTKTSPRRVWYGFATGSRRANWVMDRETFEEFYGGQS